MTTVVAALVAAEDARQRCIARGQAQWADRWASRVKHLMESAPRGAGFDSGTTLDIDSIRAGKVVFKTAFHHMGDNGMSRWTDHTVTVTAEFGGINVCVGGRNYNDIKDYIGEVFRTWLTSDAPPVPW